MSVICVALRHPPQFYTAHVLAAELLGFFRQVDVFDALLWCTRGVPGNRVQARYILCQRCTCAHRGVHDRIALRV